jgi:hypothetical protein
MTPLGIGANSILAATLMTVQSLIMSMQAIADEGEQPQNTIEATPTSQTRTLNTNPLNIPDELWVNMKELAARVQRLDKAQPIVTEGRLNPAVVADIVPKKYWELARALPVKGASANIATMDHYVELMSKKGSLGIFIGVIDVDDMSESSDDNSLREVAEWVQDIILRNYKYTGAYVAKIVKIVPSEGELERLTEAELQDGLLLYVRGQRFKGPSLRAASWAISIQTPNSFITIS